MLHPLHENSAEHFRVDAQSGECVPLTPTGLFHITLLHLNRPALVQHRFRQILIRQLTAKLGLVETEAEQLRRATTAQDEFIALLLRLIGDVAG